jgi:hypothetical protein
MSPGGAVWVHRLSLYFSDDHARLYPLLQCATEPIECRIQKAPAKTCMVVKRRAWAATGRHLESRTVLMMRIRIRELAITARHTSMHTFQAPLGRRM